MLNEGHWLNTRMDTSPFSCSFPPWLLMLLRRVLWWSEGKVQTCFSGHQFLSGKCQHLFKSKHWMNVSTSQDGFIPFPSPGSCVKICIKLIPLLLLSLPQSTLNNSSPSLVFTAFKYLQTVVMSHSSSPPFLVVSLVYVTYLALLIFLSKSIPLGPDCFCCFLRNS